ncbi:hypothetical protein BKA64DRAFT_680376 [Cadophora sp. MPI-SDFR-AT-0126]|nr:hypothetical protein BKA64DRAFT_680376 [Leotiomycetes sp. MPI-SDFR-AT-0126]
MSWAGVAFMVVLGVVLLGKQEDDDGSDYPGEATRMGEEILRKGGSSSWGFGGLRRIAVWVLWGVLAWGCWWVGCILYEAVVEAIREREREVFIVDGRRRAAGGRELDMRSRGRDSGRSGWRIVDEDSEDEYLDGHRRYESEMGESR